MKWELLKKKEKILDKFLGQTNNQTQVQSKQKERLADRKIERKSACNTITIFKAYTFKLTQVQK